MTDGNDFASPSESVRPDGTTRWASPGLTKREAFAMAAMQGFLAGGDLRQKNGEPHTYKPISETAVLTADALITALNTPS